MLRFFHTLAWAPAMLALSMPCSFADSAEIKHVLILNSYDSYSAPYNRLAAIVAAELDVRLGASVTFSEMNLDARSGDVSSRESLIVDLLENREADAPLDLVVAIGSGSIWFWMQYRDSISRDTPMIAVARHGAFERGSLRPGDVGIWAEFSYAHAIEDILDVRPATRHIVAIFGDTSADRFHMAQAQAEFATFAGRVTFEYMNDLSLGAMQPRLGELPQQAAVFYGIVNTDVEGVALRSETGLRLVRSASSAPVFGAFDYQVGMGIVGGRLIPIESTGLEAAAAAIKILRREPVGDPWQIIPSSKPVYDWRELQAWSIDSNALPAGSEVRFRPQSLWDRYAAWIYAIVAVIVAQLLLIISLVSQRRRRRNAELAQAALSGKLITAHEDERRRIARELHDDLSQRLARLAIDVALGTDKLADAASQETLHAVRSDLKQISRDVHNMCYRLHPTVLEDLGLVTAVRAECQRVRQETDSNVIETIETLAGDVGHDVALCTYRVAQEALKNAVKYADADNIRLDLTRNGKALVLTVSDDGRGFLMKSRKSEMGLGLLSMHERVKLVGGVLDIRSRVNIGTTIEATVPLNGVSL